MKMKSVHALEFMCQSPLKFYERCSACPRFGHDCPDLELGKEILRGRKKISYTLDDAPDTVRVSAFSCLAPLYYFEKTRSKCAHGGRCREEGLLLSLLEGKRSLNYAQVPVIELPSRKVRRPAAAKAPAKAAQAKK
jgi:hypothetical protein